MDDRSCQRKKNDLLSGDRTDVRMETDDIDIENIFDNGLQQRPPLFEQRNPGALDQFTSFTVPGSFGQIHFSLGQDIFQSDQDDVVKDIRFDFQGSSTHIFLFKFGYHFADLRLDLPFCPVQSYHPYLQ